MPSRDAAPLLSLLGHELRAPAGVIGGYLTLIERGADRLSPEQQQALAGARRAQQRLVEILDDSSRLVGVWRADAGVPLVVPMAGLLDDVRAAAVVHGFTVTTASLDGVAIRVTATRPALADAMAVVAGAVAREHGADVRLAVWRGDDGGVLCRLRADGAAGGPDPADAVHEPFQLLRPGLGLRVVVAATVLSGAGARVDDVLARGKRVGVDLTFPVAAD